MPDLFASQLRCRHHYDFLEQKVGFRNIKRMLEIGSGDGALIKYIRKRQKDVEITIIEPSSVFCKKLKMIENTNVINDYVENVNINGSFDLVIMSHVLEHLEDPFNTLKYIYTYFLAKGGYLYVDVPNNDYELQSKNAVRIAPNIHLFFFSGDGIKKKLINIGFEVNKINGSKYSTLPKTFINRMEKLGSSSSNNYFFNTILKIQNKITLYLQEIYRTIFFVKPKELKLDVKDKYFNNIAIIAEK